MVRTEKTARMVRRQGRPREGSRRELQLLGIRLRDDRLPEPRLRIWELLDRRDGKVYRTIKIGSQIWIAQNLDFYDSSDATLRGQTHCYYDSLAFCETYGRLYTWSAVMGFDSAYNSRLTEEGMIETPHRGVCPEGFHLPSDAEWDALAAYVDAHNGAERVSTSLKARYLWRQDRYALLRLACYTILLSRGRTFSAGLGFRGTTIISEKALRLTAKS